MERYTEKHYDGNGYYLICSGNCETFNCGDCGILDKIVDRLAAYEDTGLEPEDFKRTFTEDALLKLTGQLLGVTPDRLRELAQADREGRCVALPCKIFDKVWDVIAHYQFEITEIDILPYGKILFRCGNKGTDDYVEFYDEDLGDTFIFEEPPKRDSHIDAEAALRREQE